jgi:hypothetical protein
LFLKWIYGSSVAIRIAVYAMLLASAHVHIPDAIADGASSVGVGAAYVELVLALFWVHAAWSGVPPANRGDLTPRGAVIRCCIPFYNVYWAFAFNMRLCDALDRTLERGRDPIRAPKQLAMAAAAVNLLPLLTIVGRAPNVGVLARIAASGIWLVYMFACDRARSVVAEMVARGGR